MRTLVLVQSSNTFLSCSCCLSSFLKKSLFFCLIFFSACTPPSLSFYSSLSHSLPPFPSLSTFILYNRLLAVFTSTRLPVSLASSARDNCIDTKDQDKPTLNKPYLPLNFNPVYRDNRRRSVLLTPTRPKDILMTIPTRHKSC